MCKSTRKQICQATLGKQNFIVLTMKIGDRERKRTRHPAHLVVRHVNPNPPRKDLDLAHCTTGSLRGSVDIFRHEVYE